MSIMTQNINSITNLSVKFGKKVRKARHDLGMSQEELAAKADINISHIGQIERGLKSPKLVTVQLIAVALGTTASTLLKEHPSDEKGSAVVQPTHTSNIQ